MTVSRLHACGPPVPDVYTAKLEKERTNKRRAGRFSDTHDSAMQRVYTARAMDVRELVARDRGLPPAQGSRLRRQDEDLREEGKVPPPPQYRKQKYVCMDGKGGQEEWKGWLKPTAQHNVRSMQGRPLRRSAVINRYHFRRQRRRGRE
ncbi:hypothetical protein MRX96_055274 [Rhipicephalus microplus]